MTWRLLTGRFQALQQILDAVDAFQHDRDGGRVHVQRAIAHFAQDIFRGVCHAAETAQSEKAAGPFDGMNRAKDAGQQFGIARLFFQRDDRCIELCQVFPAFREEFLNHFICHWSALARESKSLRQCVRQQLCIV